MVFSCPPYRILFFVINRTARSTWGSDGGSGRRVAGGIEALAEAGCDRVSVGVQGFKRELHQTLPRALSPDYLPVSPWRYGRTGAQLSGVGTAGGRGEYITTFTGSQGLGAGAFSLTPVLLPDPLHGAGYLSGRGDRCTRLLKGREMKRLRLLADLFNGIRSGLKASFIDRVIAALCGIKIDRKGDARINEKGLFLLSMGMREFFRGVYLLRSRLRL